MPELELPAFMPAEHAAVRVLNTASPRYRRLARNLERLIAADPAVENLGRDPEILGVLQERGIEERDVVTSGIRVGGESFDLLCVRQTRWNDPFFKKGLQQVRSEAQELGRRTVLIPESFVQRQPRFQSTRPVARADVCVPTAKLRMKLLATLVTRGPTSLLDCISHVEDSHADPVGCILYLVNIGVVWMDLNRRFGLDRLVLVPDQQYDTLQLPYGAAA